MHYSRRNFWLLNGLSAVLLLSGFLMLRLGNAGDWGFLPVGFGVVMLVGSLLGFVSYGAMDDIQKQNMKGDWFWGSAVAMSLLLGFVFPYVLFGSGAENVIGGFSFEHLRDTPRGYFFSGVMITIMLHAVGHLSAVFFRRLREKA